MKYNKQYLSDLNDYIKEYDQKEITNYPTIDFMNKQIIFHKMDVRTSMFNPKYIKGELNQKSFVQQYMNLVKYPIVIPILLWIFLGFNFAMIYSIIIYLISYFKGDYFIFTFEEKFNFNAYRTVPLIPSKKVKKLNKFEIYYAFIQTNDVDESKKVITTDFMKLIYDCGRKVFFAFEGNEFHIAIKNKYSLLRKSPFQKFELKVDAYKQIQNKLILLIEYLNNTMEENDD